MFWRASHPFDVNFISFSLSVRVALYQKGFTRLGRLDFWSKTMVPPPPSSIPYDRFSQTRITYPRLDTCCLKLTSVLNVFLWIACTAIHSSILVAFLDYHNTYYYARNIDFIGWGIWGSLFFGITGLVGLTGAAQRSRSHLITTILFALFSIMAAIASCVLSAIASSSIYCRYVNHPLYDYRCNVWFGLEWALFTLNLIASFLNLAVLVITSKGMCSCCCCPNGTDSTASIPIVGSGQGLQHYYGTLVSPSAVLADPRNLLTNATQQDSSSLDVRGSSASNPPSYQQAVSETEDAHVPRNIQTTLRNTQEEPKDD